MEGITIFHPNTRSKKVSITRHLLFLYLVASLLADRGVKTKEGYTVASCEVLFGSAPVASGGDGREAAQLVCAVANPINKV